jgi:antitoxin component YwqK of YwqJK toxin-antitoxin module
MIFLTDTIARGIALSINAQLADIVTLNDHTFSYTYYSDGNVQTVTEKDSVNNVIKTVTYNYNASGDVSTSVTVMNGKTLTTTYNYDSNGTITSTVNVLS